MTELIAAAVFVLGGLVKGTVGIGLPTVVLALLGSVAGPREAMSLVLLPIFISNAWQVWRSPVPLSALRALWPFVTALMVLNFLVSRASFSIDGADLMRIVGAVVVAFSALNLWRRMPPLPDRLDRPAQWLLGALGGVLGGLTTLWSPPMLAYLLARQLPKDLMIASTGAILCAGALPLLASYTGAGLIDARGALLSAAMLVPTFAGYWVGERIRARIDTARFQRLLLWVFVVLGASMIVRGMG